jgi:hypothetical protein
MTMDKTIFGLRFGSNVSLQPTQEELRMFLESKKEEGGRELHGSVLATYNEMLERFLSFRRGRLPDASPRDEREKMFYGVLGNSFFSTRLKSQWSNININCRAEYDRLQETQGIHQGRRAEISPLDWKEG